MQKKLIKGKTMEHKVKSYTRRLKNGKTVTVRAHSRKGKDGTKDEEFPKRRKGSGSEVLSLKERRLSYKERPNPKDMSDDEVMAEWDQIHEEYRNDRKNGVQSGAYARIKRLSNRARKIIEQRATPTKVKESAPKKPLFSQSELKRIGLSGGTRSYRVGKSDVSITFRGKDLQSRQDYDNARKVKKPDARLVQGMKLFERSMVDKYGVFPEGKYIKK